MPVGFTNSFANRLNNSCKNSMIKEAENGDVLETGTIFIAPGNMHLEVIKNKDNKYECVLKNYPKVSNHKPSVDVLFKSVSKVIESNVVAFY